MNIYQESIFKDEQSYIMFHTKEKGEIIDFADNIILNQDEDITFSDYVLYISNRAIESATAKKDGEKIPLIKRIDFNGKESFCIDIDFENQIEEIKLVFKNHLVDDIVFKVIYRCADKNAYYAKKAEERRQELIKKAIIEIATGKNLVNIYFQPVSEEYKTSVIELYYTSKCEYYLMGKFKVDDGTFYKAITGLAERSFGIKLIQYDTSDTELFATDIMKIHIDNN